LQIIDFTKQFPLVVLGKR